MKSLSIFVIACLVLTATAGPLKELFKDVTDTEFGKTLVSSLEIQMATGKFSAAGLSDTVHGINKQLGQQLTNARDSYETQHDACDAELRKLVDGLTQAGARAGKSGEDVQMDGTALKNRQSELSNKLAFVANRQKMFAIFAKQRSTEREQFAAIKAEYAKVSATLDDIRDVVKNKLTAGSFLQMKSKMAALSSAVDSKFQAYAGYKNNARTAPSDKPSAVRHSYGIFFRLMTSILNKADSSKNHVDQKVVEVLLNILDRFEENLSATLSLERQSDMEREEAFKDVNDRLTDVINTYRDEIVDLKTLIGTLKGRIQNATLRKSMLEGLATEIQDRINDLESQCKTKQATWENFFQNISKQISTAKKLAYLVEDKRELLARFGA